MPFIKCVSKLVGKILTISNLYVSIKEINGMQLTKQEQTILRPLIYGKKCSR